MTSKVWFKGWYENSVVAHKNAFKLKREVQYTYEQVFDFFV